MKKRLIPLLLALHRKTSVLHTITSDGYYSLIYYPWNNNTCTTYGGYSTTWYAGDYEF